MSADFIAVVSAERTAGTAVAESIRFYAPAAEVLHVHYLDRRVRWPEPRGDEAAQAPKREAERRVREGLTAPDRLRIVFSVLREPAARLASVLWYDRAEWLLASRGSDGAFSAEAATWVRRRLEELVVQSRAYAGDVHVPLGIAAPAPGRWRGRDGIEVFVLRFEHLQADFEAATGALFGCPVPLLRRNAARTESDPGAYEAFRQAFAGPIAAAAAQLPSPPAAAAPSFDLSAETIAAFPAHERLRVLKRAAHGLGAADAWRAVLAEAPADLQALARLAELTSALADRAAAADALARMAAAHPLRPKRWRELAAAHRLTGDPGDELAALEKLLELEPSDLPALSRATRLLVDLGRPDDAARHKARLATLRARTREERKGDHPKAPAMCGDASP